MSLFQCSECGAKENTALVDGYWMMTFKICSECSTGKWHGEFPKTILPLGEYVTGKDGNLEHIDEQNPRGE